jgi:cytoskeleton protein RodZ
LLSAPTLNASNSTTSPNTAGALATGASGATATIPPTGAAVAASTPTATTAPVTTPASNIVITPGQRRIALTVNGRSWTEIRNRRETVLSETLNNTSKEISAAGPLSLVIGNASNVQLTVDGKPYDFSNYVRNDVARFSIE